MPKKLDIEFIRSEFKKVDLTLLTEEYINSKQKLEYVCSEGHIGSISWSSFQQGHNRCKICNIKHRVDKRRTSFEYIKLEFEKRRYTLLTKEYKNCHQKLEFICPEGHKDSMSWNNFRQEKKCGRCSRNKKLTYDFVKSFFKKKKYELLTKEYINSKQKLEYICSEGHRGSMSWNNFRTGYRCPICYRENNRGENHPTWKGGVFKLNIPLFDTHAHHIDFCEEVRRDPNNFNYLQVRCTESSCRKWFTPTNSEVQHRIAAINSTTKGGCRLYCSEECKQKCSLYQQHKYPKGQKPYISSRSNQKEWADLVKKRDNYTCRRCGATENLIAHHFEGIYQNPIESADIDMGITLCKICDKLAHKDIGCRPIDLTRKNLCKEEMRQ